MKQMNLHKLFACVKRKLFYFNDQEINLLSQVYRGDLSVKKIPDIHYLAEGMRNNHIRYIRRDPRSDRLILKTSEGTYLASDRYFWILYEVFCCHIYAMDNKYFDVYPFVVFDFGANRAYASLFFAQQPNCLKVFGYEPDKETFDFAQYNLSLNRLLAQKIELFNYGLGSENKTVDLYKIDGRDGISSLNPDLNAAISKQDKGKMQKKSINIKKVSEEVQRVINSYKDDDNLKFILKIDVEGAEYEIFEDLCENGIISKFDLIVGDSHHGLKPIEKSLEPDFELVHYSENNNCQGFLFEKKESWN
jgi:FkbM family methyltransferase